MDIHMIVSAVLTLNHSGPKHEAAVAICRNRNQDPYGWGNTFGMMNWQAVCVEALLMKEITDGF